MNLNTSDKTHRSANPQKVKIQAYVTPETKEAWENLAKAMGTDLSNCIKVVMSAEIRARNAMSSK